MILSCCRLKLKKTLYVFSVVYRSGLGDLYTVNSIVLKSELVLLLYLFVNRPSLLSEKSHVHASTSYLFNAFKVNLCHIQIEPFYESELDFGAEQRVQPCRLLLLMSLLLNTKLFTTPNLRRKRSEL